jgi:hypothetical protein
MLVAKGNEYFRHDLPFGGDGLAVIFNHIDNISYIDALLSSGSNRIENIQSANSATPF